MEENIEVVWGNETDSIKLAVIAQLLRTIVFENPVFVAECMLISDIKMRTHKLFMHYIEHTNYVDYRILSEEACEKALKDPVVRQYVVVDQEDRFAPVRLYRTSESPL